MGIRTFLRALACWILMVGLLPAQGPAVDRYGDALPPGAILRMGSVRMRHAEWIQSVAFAPDGKLLAAADSKYIVRLWDLRSGQLRLELPQGAGSLVAISPHGKILATGGYYQQKITLWDAAKGERLRELPQNARSLAFSADGKQLAAAGVDPVVKLWEVTTGALVRDFKGHKGALFSVALSKDGKYLASGGGGDGTSPQNTEVRLWDAQTGAELRRFEGHTGWIYNLAFSHQSDLLASASPYEVKLWDLALGKERHRFEKASYAVAFSPATDHLATAWRLAVHDPATGRKLVAFEEDEPAAQCLAWSPDGALLATGDRMGRLRVWDAATGDEILRDKSHTKAVRTVAFSNDGSVAASVSAEDLTVRIWGLASGAQLRKFDLASDAESTWYKHAGAIFFPPDGKLVGTYTSDGTARFWELAGTKTRVLKVAHDRISAMIMSPDGQLLAVVGGDEGYGTTVRFIELDEGKELRRFNPFGKTASHDSRISSLAFSGDSKLLAVGLTRAEQREKKGKPASDSVELWDVATGKRLRSFRRDAYAPGALAFSPDGKWLGTAATATQPLQLWDVLTGEEVRAIAPKDVGRSWYEWSTFAFSPDSKIVALVTRVNAIVLFETATARQIRRFTGHAKTITSLAFSPDGRTLLSGSEDTTVLLWDITRPPLLKKAAADDPKAWEKSWQDLADADPAIAHQAMRRLLAAPDRAIALCREKLGPMPERDPQDLPKLIAALEGAASEQKSVDALKQFGIQAAPALYEALRRKPAPKVRQHLELILEAIGEYPVGPEDLRRGRAIQMLEQIASPEAEQILSELARRSDPTARAALGRLEVRRRVAAVRVLVEKE